MENTQDFTESNEFKRNENTKEGVQAFFKNNLGGLVKSYFRYPVTATHDIFAKSDNKAYFNALILIISTALLYTVVPYLLLGSARSYIGFGPMFKIGLSIALFMVMVSVVSFGVKSIAGKPDFKKELLTGGLCAFPLCLMLVLAVLAKIFVGDINPMGFGGLSALSNLKILALPMVFVPFLLINTLLQSFRAASVNETLAWYVSPIGIALAGYATQQIVEALF